MVSSVLSFRTKGNGFAKGAGNWQAFDGSSINLTSGEGFEFKKPQG